MDVCSLFIGKGPRLPCELMVGRALYSCVETLSAMGLQINVPNQPEKDNFRNLMRSLPLHERHWERGLGEFTSGREGQYKVPFLRKKLTGAETAHGFYRYYPQHLRLIFNSKNFLF